ncbi:diguanylate cyclase (GGDEF) domain-containing protein [Paraburkholderia sartisoli]|uniref:diguanylate cyclase n=1 Tax=Paraburkholderia sartisoli TaxID=83784 RepID=A0A1H4H166_9BURK|nr:diguanylate cyclase (GGDEF) domain-containing protein [Paraburkholderia sartisoli]
MNPVNILGVTVLSGVMSMAVLGSLLRAEIPGVGCWVVANALSIVALICFASQGHVSALLSVLVANVLLAATALTGLEGFRRFFGRSGLPVTGLVGLAAVGAGIAYWQWVMPDFNARVALVSAFHAAINATLAVIVLRERPPDRAKYSYYFVAVTASLVAVGHAVRGMTYGLGLLSQARLLESSAVNIAFLALGILALPTLSIGMVMLAHDRMAERLRKLASIDDLTGAFTRREFLARADALLRSAARTGTPVTLAAIDIDHFKSINDQHGHAAGDKVLMHFASMVMEDVRTGDVFGRLGGEEFGVMCPATRAGEAVVLLNRLRDRLAASGYRLGSSPGGVLHYTFSVGVDQFRADEPLSALMARADAALYRAKASGRNRVVEAVQAEGG